MVAASAPCVQEPYRGGEYGADWADVRGRPLGWVVARGLTEAQASALGVNARSRLTTPYDLLATTIDLGAGRPWSGRWRNRRDKVAPFPGISLTRRVIPEQRTCAMAGVPSYLCTCTALGRPARTLDAACWRERHGTALAEAARAETARAIAALLEAGDPEGACRRLLPAELVLAEARVMWRLSFSGRA